MPHFIVEKIEFDFEDALGTITEQEQEFITDNALGLGWVEEETDLVDYITDKTGWCISSIKYCPNRPHPLTAYKSIYWFRDTMPHSLVMGFITVSYTHLTLPTRSYV